MIGADIAAVLPLLQAEAGSLRTTPGRLVREGEPGPPDPDTGIVTRAETVLFDGLARVKASPRVADASVDSGGVRDSRSVYLVSLPVTVTGARPGDLWRPAAGGDVLRVVEVGDGPEQTALRLMCERIEARG